MKLIDKNGNVLRIAYTGDPEDVSTQQEQKRTGRERKVAKQPAKSRPPIIGMSRNQSNGRTRLRCY